MVREPNWNPCWRSSSQIRKIFQTEDLTLRKTFRLKLANSRFLTTRGNCMIRLLMHQNKLQLFRSKFPQRWPTFGFSIIGISLIHHSAVLFWRSKDTILYLTIVY